MISGPPHPSRILILVRILAGLLSLACIQQAAAGLLLSRGAMDLALRIDPGDLKAVQAVTEAAWSKSEATGSPHALEAARNAAGQWIRLAPKVSRGWFYRGAALQRLQMAQEPARRSAAVWEGIKFDFNLALYLDPGSAWLHFEIGKNYLMRLGELTDKEHAFAFGLLKKSIDFPHTYAKHPHLDEASPYLVASLTLLWETKHDLSDLIDITPKDRASYGVLRQWLMARSLWGAVEHIYPAYLSLRAQDYENHCQQGEALLVRHRTREAFWQFRKAFWAESWAYPRAKAGILVSRFRMDDLDFQGTDPLLREPVDRTLRMILEDEDQTIGDLLPMLRLVILETDDPFLLGLYSYRLGEYPSARRYFEKASGGEAAHLRYLASSYAETGDRDRAIEVLRPSLDQKVIDLRDLLLLREWLPGDPEVVKKFDEAVRTSYGPERWWGKQADKQTLTLNLLPGRADIFIGLRGAPGADGKFPFVEFRLNGRPLKGVYADRSQGQAVSLNLETTGGIRYLEAVRLTDASQDSPGLTLGSVRIKQKGAAA